MTNTWTNREIIKRYFSGMIDLECELIEQDLERSNKYRHENTVFVQEIKRVLDEFCKQLTPELKDMYVSKYKENTPFIEFYNVVAPTGYIMALNKELNNIVSQIERPQERLYA
ncbi:hypothetical protein [Leuconostoc pseudomesenteroides]|uniref:hypothetical protein n=1 Tax=Leuconostoc pseudomesenteroides TaxID=33968 RepID=UPI0022866DD7|nr:hypothetical protein [Leuconostoc pseudomesenteroides]WAM38248.1 hypothetical protein OYT93_08560 [Leuconostoc pseudomesenteroides]